MTTRLSARVGACEISLIFFLADDCNYFSSLAARFSARWFQQRWWEVVGKTRSSSDHVPVRHLPPQAEEHTPLDLSVHAAHHPNSPCSPCSRVPSRPAPSSHPPSLQPHTTAPSSPDLVRLQGTPRQPKCRHSHRSRGDYPATLGTRPPSDSSVSRSRSYSALSSLPPTPETSVFSAVRLRTDATRRMKRRDSALCLVYKVDRRLGDRCMEGGTR